MNVSRSEMPFRSTVVPYDASLDVTRKGKVDFENGLAIGRTIEALTEVDQVLNGEITRIANTHPLDLTGNGRVDFLDGLAWQNRC